MNEKGIENLQKSNIYILIGFLAVAVTIAIDVQYGTLIASTWTSAFVIGLVFLLFAVMKLTLSSSLINFWHNGNIGLMIVMSIFIMILMTVSIFASVGFQSFQNSTNSEARLQSSLEFKQAVATRESSEKAVQELAMSEQTYQNAVQSEQAISQKIAKIANDYAQYASYTFANGQFLCSPKKDASGKSFIGKSKELCASLSAFSTDLSSIDATKQQWEKYQGALVYHEKVNSTPLPKAVESSKAVDIVAFLNLVGLQVTEENYNGWLVSRAFGVAVLLELLSVFSFYLSAYYRHSSQDGITEFEYSDKGSANTLLDRVKNGFNSVKNTWQGDGKGVQPMTASKPVERDLQGVDTRAPIVQHDPVYDDSRDYKGNSIGFIPNDKGHQTAYNFTPFQVSDLPETGVKMPEAIVSKVVDSPVQTQVEKISVNGVQMFLKACPDCGEKFVTEYPNRIFCDKHATERRKSKNKVAPTYPISS